MFNEFSYVFLTYHPTPKLGDLGTRFSVAIVGFPLKPESHAKLWIQNRRLEAVKVFGGPEDQLVVKEYLSALLEMLSTYPLTTDVIHNLDSRFAQEPEILRFSDVHGIVVKLLSEIPQSLGIEVEEATYDLLGSWPETWRALRSQGD